MIRRFLFAALIATSSFSTNTFAIELMRWERLPLPVPLVVGQERVVFIDRDVKVGMDRALTGKLRVQSAGGAVYLQAQTEIPPTRLQLQDVQSGEIVLLDVAATSGKQALEPIRVVFDDQPVEEPTRTAGEMEPTDKPEPVTPVPVALTRYAAQNLYAPLRTVEELSGVRRVPLRLQGEIPTLLPTAPVNSQPMAAWRLAEFWVTAVRITNRGHQHIELDPRQLQGQFYAATFQHPSLGPSRTPEDTTVLYLVTQGGGLERAVLPAMITEGPSDEE